MIPEECRNSEWGRHVEPVISVSNCHLRSYPSSPPLSVISAKAEIQRTHTNLSPTPRLSSPRRRRSSARLVNLSSPPLPVISAKAEIQRTHTNRSPTPRLSSPPLPVISTKMEIQRNDIYVGILNCPCGSQLPVNLSVVVPTFLSCLCGSQLRFLQVKFHIRILIQIVNNTSSATDPVRNQACLT